MNDSQHQPIFMQSLIDEYQNKMEEFITEFESLLERIASIGEKVEEEKEAIEYIKGDIDDITKEVGEDARNIEELGTSYVKPEGPPPLVKLSFALQLMYSRKVSLTLLETEYKRLGMIHELTLKRAEESRMD